MKNIIIYSTPTCPYCVLVKNYLDQKNIKYEYIDVSENQEKAQEMIKKSGQEGVPVVDIDGKIIIGFDKNAIDQALEKSSNLAKRGQIDDRGLTRKINPKYCK